ncbi:MAG TPA: VOC family protein [Gemmatimonadota bacterium]|nr:VOC family protein [Gemmatimonadota bacterium]
MIDHVSVKTSNQAASRRFYEKALAPLGYEVLMEFHDGAVVGMGIGRKPDFWFSSGKPSSPIHVAFSAPDRATVDAFYEAALASGGKDNGAPGLRTEYHAGYYGAFVHDPDGNNVEAVFHDPSEMKKG